MLDRQWTALCRSRGKWLFSNHLPPNLWTAKSQRRHDIGGQLHVPDAAAGSMTEAPQILLNHRLKSLRLPTVLREYGKLAKQAAAEGLDHVQFLARLIELEMPGGERRQIMMCGRSPPDHDVRAFARWRERRMIERPLSGHCCTMPCRATGSRPPNSPPSKAPLSRLQACAAGQRDSFDFKAIPALNKMQVLELARCEWPYGPSR